MPGCPLGWLMNGAYCYKLFGEHQGLTWIDAQKACNLERSNLLTIENKEEYKFIYGNFCLEA